MIRTDGAGTASPRLLDAAIDENLFQQIEKYFLEGYTVFAAHCGNVHRNLHSMNIRVRSDDIYVEVVGPGFMATDLDRYGMVPHESFDINGRYLSVSNKKLNEQRYAEDRARRLASSDEQELKSARSFLLDYPQYLPLSGGEIGFIREAALKLYDWRRTNNKGDFIASGSFLDMGVEGQTDIKPVFWDIHEETPKTRPSADQTDLNKFPIDESKFYRHEGD